jgi:hypothetical protein
MDASSGSKKGKGRGFYGALVALLVAGSLLPKRAARAPGAFSADENAFIDAGDVAYGVIGLAIGMAVTLLTLPFVNSVATTATKDKNATSAQSGVITLYQILFLLLPLLLVVGAIAYRRSHA